MPTTEHRLAIVTITGARGPALLAALEARGMQATLVACVSLLSETGATLLVPLDASRVDELLELVASRAGVRARMVEVGVASGPFRPQPDMMIEAAVGGARVVILIPSREERLGGGR